MKFHDIEAAAFRSWPALKESEENGIVLRFSNGYTKRANSANVLTEQDGDFASLLGHYEAYFKDKALQCVFRIPSFSNNHKLDDYLDRHGYEAIDHTLVLQRSLDGASFDDSEILNSSCDDWMAAFCRINESDINDHATHLDMIKRIEDTMLMAVLVEEGVEIACGLGVISNGYFGLFDIVTKSDSRNRGYGTALLSGMLHWALKNGATTAYLQVVADNSAAIRLYEKFGFTYCYDYWYRIRKLENLTVNNAFSIADGNPELADTLESELLKSLRDHLPQSLNTSFVLSAKNSQGDIIGGLTASTSYGWLLIKVLWVDESHRHSGIGHSLMKSAEIKASELGCHSAWLDTSNPDAMTFYLSLGYECFGELANTETQYPPQHHRWFMKKVL